MVSLGIEVLLQRQRNLIEGKRLGLVTNYTVTDSRFRPIVDLLCAEDGWRVNKLFGPEHGMRNSAKEGEHVSSEVDPHTGLIAYSLYGQTKKPSAEMLADLDVVVFDLYDIGARYYTNMNTMAYCMEACAEVGLPMVVLDRPNPINGVHREGNILRPEFSSFVGLYPIPNRHGLTMGELALLYNQRIHPACDLTVVRAEGWERRMMLVDTGIPFVSSSPNTTNLDMVLLYPGMCLFEGVNVSLGRGTTKPFEVVGAPFFDGHKLADAVNARQLSGVVARPVYFSPTYSQYAGELCQGVQVHVTDRSVVHALEVGIVAMETVFSLYPNDLEFLPPSASGKRFIDLLAGTDELPKLVTEQRALEYIWQAAGEVEQFNQEVRQFYLY